MARRLRKAKSFRRTGPVREAYAFVLVVCEGTKSEPNYFKRLRHVYRLSSANVVISPANGNDPLSVVECAKAQLEENSYDRVYCVFDRNGHCNYVEAINNLSQLNNIVAITSEPCFEVWVLLHFVYSTAPFKPIGTDSACAMVIKEVKKHLPKYAKGYDSVFDDIEPRMDQAIKHARQLSVHNDTVGSTNPATEVHMLVDYLKKLRTTNMSDSDDVKRSVELQHHCSAKIAQSVPVKEMHEEVTVWEGVVHVFDLEGHSKATRAYAWSSPIEGSTKRRFFAVLHIPPIMSPEDAVRAAIVAEHRRK